MIEKLGSRKFIISILLLGLIFSLVIVGKVEVEEFLTFASIVTGLYITGNVAQKFSNQ